MSNNTKVGGVAKQKATPSPILDTTPVDLDKRELELLLILIKNGTFKGEYIEVLYNLTLKIQNSFLDLK